MSLGTTKYFAVDVVVACLRLLHDDSQLHSFWIVDFEWSLYILATSKEKKCQIRPLYLAYLHYIMTMSLHMSSFIRADLQNRKKLKLMLWWSCETQTLSMGCFLTENTDLPKWKNILFGWTQLQLKSSCTGTCTLHGFRQKPKTMKTSC